MINHGLFFVGMLVSNSASFFSIAEVKISKVVSVSRFLATLLLSSNLNPAYFNLDLSMNVFGFLWIVVSLIFCGLG